MQSIWHKTRSVNSTTISIILSLLRPRRELLRTAVTEIAKVEKRFRAFPSQAPGRSGQTHNDVGTIQINSQFLPRLATAQCKSGLKAGLH